MRLVIAAALLVLPFAASAQTASTNCRPDFIGGWNCQSRATPGPVTANPNAFDGLIRSTPDYSAATGAIARAIRVREVRERVDTATRMIANGDCVGAEQFALRAGDLVLAREVKSYCAQ
jgi:hypothetical protein